MADYIYLLENRLSADQQHALRQIREAAREAEMILFLTGDAVRDLTSGQAVRELEVAVHGNALKLKKTIAKLGAKIWGEDETAKSLYLCFPGTVRVDVISTHRTEYPHPGKPVFHPANIQDDLRRRDFTVNAMAISLNEGSFGLLMDPLNGAADIESRTLRLVSNYGFLEEPALLIRATRYLARLGWDLDPKTQTRYENAKAENGIESLSAEERSRELEQIGHEEDGLKVLKALEAEGWMKVLFPAWTVAKVDEEKLKALHDLAVGLFVQGVHPDMSAAQTQLLTAGLAAKDLAALKKLMLRPGFVEEWNSLDSLASTFAKVLLSKANAKPSASFKLFTSYDPEAILWLGFTSKDAAVRERYDQFLKVWPEARQRIPHVLMQEMRITPELAAYREIVLAVFLELIDGKLTTPEELRAFLEPHSPPAPPPQVTIKRPRAKRGAEAKVKERSYDDDEAEDGHEEESDHDDLGSDDDDLELGLKLPKIELDPDLVEDSESAEIETDDEEAEPAQLPAKRIGKAPKDGKAAKAGPAATAAAQSPAAAKAGKPTATVPAAPASKPVPQVKPTGAAAAKAPAKSPLKPAAKSAAKPAVKAAAKPAVKAAAKPPAKAPAKSHGKPAAKTPGKASGKPASKTSAAKSAPAKGKPAANSKSSKASHAAKPSKPAAKKPAPKAAKKR
jgi:tRNA nucleotidyltransferase (CCA-adding enzyme)